MIYYLLHFKIVCNKKYFLCFITKDNIFSNLIFDTVNLK